MNDQSHEENNGVSPQPLTWLEAIVDTVSACIEAHNPMGPLEYWYSTGEEITELIICPTPVELVGGEVDGTVVIAGFSLDLHTLQSVFERVDAVYWQAHSMGPHDLEGPHLSLEGVYQGQKVWLRMLSDPPEEVKPGLRLDISRQG